MSSRSLPFSQLKMNKFCNYFFLILLKTLFFHSFFSFLLIRCNLIVNAYSRTISRTIIYPGTVRFSWLSMSTHGYNPVNYQCHYNWARSHLIWQPDNCDILINVSYRTQSTLLQSYELSMPLPLGMILFAIQTGQCLKHGYNNIVKQLQYGYDGVTYKYAHWMGLVYVFIRLARIDLT